jgi:hypothetical protein
MAKHSTQYIAQYIAQCIAQYVTQYIAQCITQYVTQYSTCHYRLANSTVPVTTDLPTFTGLVSGPRFRKHVSVGAAVSIFQAVQDGSALHAAQQPAAPLTLWTWVYACMSVCVYGCMRVWVYACMRVCVCGCMRV